jgi:hypothetical protein|tara:strand:+ start:1597 stop:1770 length:174 start_codon:yes stop_codon:yes gene_type:complete
MEKPMSYLLFKASLEMAHISTFERDWEVQELYKKYLKNFPEKKSLPISLPILRINKQ